VKWSFKYRNYGQAKRQSAKNPERRTFQFDFPLKFKLFFFSMLKASIRTADGLKIRKGFPSNVWKPVCALPGDSLPSKPDLKGARSLIKRTGFAD